MKNIHREEMMPKHVLKIPVEKHSIDKRNVKIINKI